MSVSPHTESNGPQWEGLHGQRYTGIGVVSGGNFDGAEAWTSSLNLPARKPGESWFDWSGRLAAEREAAKGVTIDGEVVIEQEEVQ